MPLLSQVHAPNDAQEERPYTYALSPYFPKLYPSQPTPQPDPDPSPEPTDGNDYLQAMCDGSVQVGMAVMSQASSNGSSVLFPAQSTSPQPVIGIVVAAISPNHVTIQTDGLVTKGINGLIPGSNYYVDSNGGLRAPPLTGILYAQLIGQARSETSLYLANNGQVFKRQVSDDGQDENQNSGP
jgi:hypothetical protein